MQNMFFFSPSRLSCTIEWILFTEDIGILRGWLLSYRIILLAPETYLEQRTEQRNSRNLGLWGSLVILVKNVYDFRVSVLQDGNRSDSPQRIIFIVIPIIIGVFGHWLATSHKSSSFQRVVTVARSLCLPLCQSLGTKAKNLGPDRWFFFLGPS